MSIHIQIIDGIPQTFLTHAFFFLPKSNPIPFTPPSYISIEFVARSSLWLLGVV
ncbi:hypothetical protein HanIR_Chr17g0883151 [Helianthus annuus]|nr:hypothetical protein HanIR_Chr17g0883151 [Helianthus annuus]